MKEEIVMKLPHNHNQNMDKVLKCIPNEDNCTEVAAIFKQLSDASRIRILWMLCHCEECVSDISAAMQMSDPAVSHHLKFLKNAGLVVSRREGKEVFYKLADTAIANHVHHIIDEMFEIACPGDVKKDKKC